MKRHFSKPLRAHLSIFCAEIFWGSMAPIGKSAMTHGIDGIDLVTFRVIGGVLLFWLSSLFVPTEHVPVKDKLKFIGAAVLGLICNQFCYNIGLSITSPNNASIMTTTMPIFSMIFSFLILKEPITIKKLSGVFIGCMGALILILTSVSASNAKVGNIRGDLLCLIAQCSFALYLTLYNPLVRKYSVITTNKWMFLWAAILIVPFSGYHVTTTVNWGHIPASTWWEAGYVVFIGTYVCYLLTMIAQQVLRPTVVSIYNYIQPIVAVTISVLTGIGIFKWSQGLAIILVFSGVWLVTHSKSKRDTDIMKHEVTRKP
ncbi:DMT family transporter [Prevotella cerevisiae]|uniref:DMT family transporter n=1 Tax=Segatella cerevisiae TaxID=2053716 RepID=A0ABT1BTN1_9BACT|nr:DMT family transporter [Segatella cerevisiae]MCO6024319.1 DMT family transporter [Segatella cerevisiae]